MTKSMENSPPLPDRIYELLLEDEDARVCRDIPDSACHEQPRAFVTQIAALTLTKLGDALTSSRLVLAWILSSIGAPAFLTGMLVPVRESLALLPQLFIARWMREHPQRKWFWVWGSAGQALALCAMVVILLALPGNIAGYGIVLMLALFSLARGVCSVAAKDVLGKTISKSRRGRLTGVAAAAAGLVFLGVALSLILAPAASRGGDEGLFASILGAAAVAWLCAAAIYAFTPEVPGATQGGGNAFGEAMGSLALLRDDRQLRDFILARMLLVASTFAIPYLVVLVQRSGSGSLDGLAVLMLAEGAAGLASGRFWGRWSDRASNHVMGAAAGLTALAIAAALVSSLWFEDWLTGYASGFALLFMASVAHDGVRVGRKTYLVDMATLDNRAEYTAVSNTVMGLFLLAGAGLGLVDAWLGVDAVLGLLLVFALLAIGRSLTLQSVN